MVISFTVDSAEVQSNLDKIVGRFAQAHSTALDEMEKIAIEGARKIVPVRTGRLKNSIKRQSKTKDTVIVGSNLDYAIFVEKGTYRMPKRPYLAPQIPKVQSEGGAILLRAMGLIGGGGGAGKAQTARVR